jgi:hypothetical protein
MILCERINVPDSSLSLSRRTPNQSKSSSGNAIDLDLSFIVFLMASLLLMSLIVSRLSWILCGEAFI